MTADERHFDSLDGRDLRLLVELERLGSINRAAHACGIGQPAATKRLQRMGSALGFDLVQTDGGSARLTLQGEKVAEHGRRVLRSLDRLQLELEAVSAEGATAGIRLSGDD